MVEFLKANTGNIVVGLIVFGALALVVIRLVINARSGKAGCGCAGCAGCKKSLG